MNYIRVCFNTKRDQDPNKLWIPGIPVQDVIHELMRKFDLTSYLEVHTMNDIERYVMMVRDGKPDIIYIDIHGTNENLFDIINASIGILSESGFILVDWMFPYYKEFDNPEIRSFIKYRQCCEGYQFNLLWDCSYGLGVIRKGDDQSACYNVKDALDMKYEEFEWFLGICMNPVETKTFLNVHECKSTKYKYAVLTAIFGNYELIREVQNPRSDVEYVVVTDNPNLTSSTWKVKLVDSFFDGMSGYAKSFYVKYHPFEFIESDVFLWVDGSIQIKKDFTDALMEPFINSNYEVIELTNMVTNIGRWEAGRWVVNNFHGFTQHQRDVIDGIFKDEPWVDESQVQTTIYGGKNTRLVNMVNNRTWDVMMRNPGEGKDIAILYMPQRGMMISKYMWNTHKACIYESKILFSDYFEYCYHNSTDSQRDNWEKYWDQLSPALWGSDENMIIPKKLN
jgi:hypothetical protein